VRANASIVLAALVAAAGTSGAMAAETTAREDQIVTMGIPSGSQTVAADAGGVTRAEFSFNDRGRGDHIVATWKLDAAGVLTEYQGSGNDYMKAPVTETFHLTAGKASWQNRAERGDKALSGEAFYMPVNAPPEMLGVLARALLNAPQHRLALLPAGEASIETVGPLSDGGASGTPAVTLYEISGLDFSPTPVWLDGSGGTAAIAAPWFSVLSAPARDLRLRLLAAQATAADAFAAHQARELTHVPGGDVLIRNARLFDPRDLSVTAGTSVLIRGEHIVRVAPDAALTAPAGAEVIEARGRFLMPGLWDNHQHFFGDVGVLDIANGVTSARDMANDTDDFPKRVARFDAGSELGPRVWKSGIIDGPA
jgi:hypothetical protein